MINNDKGSGVVGASKNNDIDSIESFFNQDDALDRLAAIAVTISPDDQDYIAEQVNDMLNSQDSYEIIQKRMMEFLDPEETFPEVRDFVLENKGISPLDASEATDEFQNMILKLRSLVENGDDGATFAKAVMFYVVGMAHYEWKDRQRDSIAYDEDLHGPITLSSGGISNDID